MKNSVLDYMFCKLTYRAGSAQKGNYVCSRSGRHKEDTGELVWSDKNRLIQMNL